MSLSKVNSPMDDSANYLKFCYKCLNQIGIFSPLEYKEKIKDFVILTCKRNKNHKKIIHRENLNKLNDIGEKPKHKAYIKIKCVYLPDDEQERREKQFNILGNDAFDESNEPNYFDRYKNIIIIKVNGERIIGNNYFFKPKIEYEIDIIFTEYPDSLSYIFYENSILKEILIFNMGSAHINSLEGAFEECVNLTNISGLAELDVKQVTNFKNCFRSCQNLSDINPLSEWEPLLASDLSGMFYGCGSLDNIEPLMVFNISSSKKIDVDIMFYDSDVDYQKFINYFEEQRFTNLESICNSDNSDEYNFEE